MIPESTTGPMPGSEQQTPGLHFGVFELNLQSRELLKRGVKVKLQDQPLQVLTLLLERAGEIVTRDEIQKRIWPDNTFVDFDNAINSAVRKLRETLGDTPESPRFVETLPRRGYRFIAPVSCHREPLSQTGAPAVSTQVQLHAGGHRRFRLSRLSIALMAAAAVLVALFVVGSLRKTTKATPPDQQVAPLTSNLGLELQPSISPDGTRVAYAWTIPPRQPAIYVKLIGPGDPVKISKDLQRVFSPVWSPDGRWIAALQDLGQIGLIVLIPASGGQFRQLARITKAEPSDDTCASSQFEFICGASSFGSALAWSLDSKYLFTSAKPAPDAPPAIVRVSAETGDLETLTSPPKGSGGDFGPAVSPDGERLAFGRFMTIRTGDLYVLPLSYAGSSKPVPRRITADAADIHTAAWMPDGRELIFSSDRAGRRELWRVSATGAPAIVRVPGIGENALDVAVSQNGKTLIYNRGHYTGSLWKIPIVNGKGGAPVRLTATTARDKFSQFSPDGKHIAFQSARSGVDEIWVSDADGTNAVQLTSFKSGISGTPRWSPDGRTIAFDSNVAGSFHIYIISWDGGKARQLTNNSSTDAVPSWSRDGAWIYFTSWRTGRPEVWKVRAIGGSETQITSDGGALATESADGRYLYFVRGTEDLGDLFRMPKEGGKAIKVLSGIAGRTFTMFSKGMYIVGGSPQAELRYLDFASGSIRVIAPMPGLPQADVSPDQRSALYAQPAMSDTDLMVVENFGNDLLR